MLLTFCTAPESSASAGSRQKHSDVTKRNCVSCDERLPENATFRAPCGHRYCRECLHTMFEKSTTTEAMFPPRCCRQTIPIQSVQSYLSPDLMRTLAKKNTEFQTDKRTYCSWRLCSSFIDAAYIVGDRATCPSCGTRTCTICKSRAHEGDCPKDEGTQKVLETARAKRWRRCYRCRTMVELEHGCNHI